MRPSLPSSKFVLPLLLVSGVFTAFAAGVMAAQPKGFSFSLVVHDEQAPSQSLQGVREVTTDGQPVPLPATTWSCKQLPFESDTVPCAKGATCKAAQRQSTTVECTYGTAKIRLPVSCQDSQTGRSHSSIVLEDATKARVTIELSCAHVK